MEAFPEDPTSVIDPQKFVLAGKAIFTIESKKTKSRFTYKVSKAKDGDIWFVGVLTGSDNNSDYSYMGIIKKDLYYQRTAKSKLSNEAPSQVAFRWAWDKICKGALSKQANFYHEGRCGRCGRRLTVPESVKSGFGPECVTKVLG